MAPTLSYGGEATLDTHDLPVVEQSWTADPKAVLCIHESSYEMQLSACCWYSTLYLYFLASPEWAYVVHGRLTMEMT